MPLYIVSYAGIPPSMTMCSGNLPLSIQIEHSYDLTSSQKDQLAQAITTLHSVTFLTPSLYVNVQFHSTASSKDDYYVAGGSIPPPNRIFATVRTGPSRSKDTFDYVATQLENIWYDVVNGDEISDPVVVNAGKGIFKGGVMTGVVEGINSEVKAPVKRAKGTAEEKRRKKMHFVVFQGMITGRENGVHIPSADNEKTWVIDNMEYFKEQAAEGDELFVDMLKELETRPDLNKLTLPN